jgi:predicted nucleic acid-binding protein
MTASPAVIDTNVVVSGLLTKLAESPTAWILDRMLAGGFRFLLSIDLLAEYRTVLLRPKIRRRHRLRPREIDRILTEIAANAAFPEVDQTETTGDRHLWVLLSAVPGAILVTGDRRLIERPAGSGRVVLPRAFVDQLEPRGLRQ